MEAVMKLSLPGRGFPMKLKPVAVLLENTKWENFTEANTANHSGFMDLIIVILMPIKEPLLYMVMIVSPTRRSTHECFAIAWAV